MRGGKARMNQAVADADAAAVSHVAQAEEQVAAMSAAMDSAQAECGKLEKQLRPACPAVCRWRR
jgi:ribosome-associated translation inhibitor RaiA